ncbi:uncharacterized protein PG986_002866 [Apiospora aurea]|uniref:Uncharacterized protein n=1 Tax=Apiospora aurea TaxID=335848 RepID=A0ABR1QQ14_9PEZI
MDQGLPAVPGPKLYPFKDGGGPLEIKFVQYIGEGLHAYTWTVLINGKLYALKVFNFYERYTIRKRWKVKVSKEEEVAYFDPFNCECRAYGRIREKRLEQYIAKCYGYIMLARNDFEPLWKNPKLWEEYLGYREEHKGRPFPALVKEYIETDPDRYPVLPGRFIYNVRPTNRFFRDAKDAKHLIRGLKQIQKSGILIRDINDGNVFPVNGHLIDFSQAWTVPHPVLVKEKMENDKIVDVFDGGYLDAHPVDRLIDKWNHEHDPRLRIWDRCLPNHDYCDEIRHRNDRMNGKLGAKWKFSRKTCGWYIRPELYRWKDDDEL